MWTIGSNRPDWLPKVQTNSRRLKPLPDLGNDYTNFVVLCEGYGLFEINALNFASAPITEKTWQGSSIEIPLTWSCVRDNSPLKRFDEKIILYHCDVCPLCLWWQF